MSLNLETLYNIQPKNSLSDSHRSHYLMSSSSSSSQHPSRSDPAAPPSHHAPTESPFHPGAVDGSSVEPAEVARLKRRLAAAQEEVKELSGTKQKKTPCVNLFHCCYIPVAFLNACL